MPDVIRDDDANPTPIAAYGTRETRATAAARGLVRRASEASLLGLILALSLFTGCKPAGRPLPTPGHRFDAQTAIPTIRRVSTYMLPAQTRDQANKPTKISGLSGITYLGPERSNSNVNAAPLPFEQTWHRFAAVTDGNNAHTVLMRVLFSPHGAIRDVDVTQAVRLQDTYDFEGIAAGPSVAGQTAWVWLSDEMIKRPAIHRYDLATGSRLESYELPRVSSDTATLSNELPAANPWRRNKALESLTKSHDGSELWTANEQALVPDGPTATAQQGTTVRLFRFAILGDTTLIPAGQFAYQVDPVHGSMTKRAQSGLVELMLTPHGHMLALERSAVPSLNPFRNRLYLVDFRDADDISDLTHGLQNAQARFYRTLNKQLLWETNWLTSPGNLEGLCVGPQLPNGRYVVVGIVDDGDLLSRNLLLGFELGLQPAEPVAAVH